MYVVYFNLKVINIGYLCANNKLTQLLLSMDNQQKKSLLPNNILIPVLFVLFTLAFGIVYILVDKNADEKDYKIFDVVTPLLALIISVIGAVYIYNAYQAQQEQIRIQKQEIKDNRKDIEYNRLLDIVFRQLEFSKTELSNLKDVYYKTFINHQTSYSVFPELSSYKYLCSVLLMYYQFFDKIITSSNINNEDKKTLINVISNNTIIELPMLIIKLGSIFKYSDDSKPTKEVLESYYIFLDNYFLRTYFYDVERYNEEIGEDDRLKIIKELKKEEYIDSIKIFTDVNTLIHNIIPILNKYSKKIIT